MQREFLLDTNIVSAAIDGDPNVWAEIATANEVLLSSIVVGELHFGASKSSRPQDNLREIENFVGSVAVLPVDLMTARIYGRLKVELEKAGTRIPDNDTWIAAAALQHSLTVSTRDAHFGYVPGLHTVAW